MSKLKFLLITVLILACSSLFAKEYTIDNVNIRAEINANGTVDLTEARVYTFEEEFSWANYTIRKSGFTELTDISIRDAQGKYVNENTEEPRTFMVTTNEEEINLKWFYEAEDETRRFTIDYTIHGALAVGPEWTELFWTFIGDSWKKTTQQASVRILLPGDVGKDSVHAWLRTRNELTQTIPKSDGVLVNVTQLRSDQSLKVRFLFPTSVLATTEITAPELSLVSATSEEQAYQKQRQERIERRKQYASLGWYLTLIVAGLSGLIWIFFFSRYGKRHHPRAIPDQLYSPPTSEPPAIIGWLMQSQSVNGSHLLATIFDSARRGYFKIHEEEGEKKFLQKKKPRYRVEKAEEPSSVDLLDWEQDLYEYVTDQMQDDSIYFDELTDQRSDMQKWFSKWAKSVKEDAKSRNWIDSESVKGAIINGVIQSLLLAGSLLAIYWAGGFGAVALGATLLFGLLSFAIVHRTKIGEQVYQQWKAFKNSIKKGSGRQFGTSHIDKMIIYAIALGVSEKYLENWLAGTQVQLAHIPWIVFMTSTSNPAEVAASMNALASSGLTTVSSVAGAGGASAGSAGGGTGGGAG
ncbi:MAG: hypothetical protein MAGBODY4_00854 [Candidatus Marinimicrobia bacterium]|nr:hypothetical protein [Candidatus Neomarinimicrobiota bacterium]